MKCPKCNSDMVKGKKYWICEECDEKISIQVNEENSSFNINAVNNFPTIISHEYNRLRELSIAGESYGTFMQIKDMYEVILKFPVLIMINGLIYSLKNEKECGKRNEILKAFISKSLSLGDWETIGTKIGKLSNEELPKRNSEMYVEIRNHLKEVMNYYKVKVNNTEKLVSSWRNDEIAHGALSFDNTKFKDEIEDMLKNIHTIMEKSEKFYANIEMVTNKGDILKGHEIKKINEEDVILIKYNLKTQDNGSELSPLIYGESNEIKVCDEITEICYTYMFDSFVHYTNTAYRLNYSHGKKDKCYKSVDTLLELKKLLNVQELENESIERENHLTSQLEKIEDILKSKKLIKPTYLNDYILSRLGYGEMKKSYTKGVFMLRAERGMGKTIFTKMLDDLDYTSAQEEKPASYNKIIKRVYHINNTYGSELNTFKHILQNDLCSTLEKYNAYVGQIREEFSNLDFCKDIESIKIQFAKILKMAFEELNRAYNKESGIEREKFLLVIDGLDEFNYKHETLDKTILDYIPKPEMLDEGIFILLTSRTHEELEESERLQREIEKIQLTESAEVITRKSTEYVSLLKKHLEKNLLITKSKEQNDLLGSLDYRFSYLGAYEKLYCSNLISKEDINPRNIIKSYLDFLQKTNKRHFENIKRLLLILAISPVGIRIEELCFLMNEHAVTYRLLGTIADMSNFIESKREDGVTIISLSHQDWKEVLLKNYNNDIEILLEEYRKIFNTLSNRLFLKSDDESYVEFKRDFNKFRGYFYVLTHYYTINKFINMRNNIILPDETIRKHIEILKRVSDKLKMPDCKKECFYAKVNFLNGMIITCERIIDFNTDDILDLAKMYSNRGVKLRILTRLEESLKDCDKAIEIIEELDKKGKFSDRNNLATLYMNRGVTLDNLNMLEESLKDHSKAIEIIEKLDEKDNILDRNGLVQVYSNRGVTLNNLNMLEEALKDYGKAIEIIKELDKKGNVLDINELATVYINRGVTLDSLTRFEESLKDYDKAIEIIEEMDKKRNLLDRNNLAIVYSNRGVVLNNLDMLEESLKDYDKAIEIIEELDKKGNLLDRNKLATVYMNRGGVLNKLDMLEESLKDYNKAIEIIEELYKKRKLLYRNDLATVYMNRGVTLRNLTRLEEALKDHDKAIEIIEELDKKRNFKDRNELATMYVTRGVTLDNLKRLKEALKDYGKAMEIIEELDKEGEFKDRNNLATVYSNRAVTLKKSIRLEEALKDCDKAIEIIEEIDEKENLLDRNKLATVYKNRGVILRSLTRLEEALQDALKTLRIYKEIINERFGLQKNLIQAMYMVMNLSDRLGCFDKYVEEIVDCLPLIREEKLEEKSIKILDQIIGMLENKQIVENEDSEEKFNKLIAIISKIKLKNNNGENVEFIIIDLLNIFEILYGVYESQSNEGILFLRVNILHDNVRLEFIQDEQELNQVMKAYKQKLN